MSKLSAKDQSVQGPDKGEEGGLDGHPPTLPPPLERRSEDPLETALGTKATKDTLIEQDPVQKEALAEHFLRFEYPKGWKASRLATYSGTRDPNDHIHTFTIGMKDMAQCRDIWCRMFRCTLIGDIVGWYCMLPIGSIHLYQELERTFKIVFSQ